MAGVAVAIPVIVAGIVACVAAYLLATRALRKSKALDETWGGLRKVHVFPTPRLGGIAIAAGLLIGLAVECAIYRALCPWWLLVLCAVPAFAWGLIEDFTARGAALVRFVLTAVAAALGFFLLDARITQLDVPGLDYLLQFHVFSFVFTLVAVAGVAHAVNIIDGLNGLAGVVGLLAAIGLAIVAAIVGDTLVLGAALVLAGSIAGFLAINFPRGRIFLGDGGAYLVGLLLAELAVMLVHRNSEVSPWFALILLAYPIWETLFSMYRRSNHGRSTNDADALHLHTLVYRRVVRWKSFQGSPRDYVTRNSIASACLWTVPAVCLAVALAFWGNSLALQAAAALFGLFYTLAYRRLARFRVPRWLVLRAPQGVKVLAADGAVHGQWDKASS